MAAVWFRELPVISDLELSRFWAKVALPDANGCMLWAAVKTSEGYGHFRLSGQMYQANRIALALATGEAPRDLEVAHSCRNRHCVAAPHLSWSTRKQNHADKVRDGTHNRGERHVMAVLTEAQVLEIRQLAKSKGLSELSRLYGISTSTVWRTIKRINWSHLVDPEEVL